MAPLTKLFELVIRQARQLSFFAIIFFAFVFVWNQNSSVDLKRPMCKRRQVQNDTEETNKYISSLCNCGKEMVMGNESIQPHPDAFKWCSDESSIRGMQQKVIAYTLYGNVHNSSVAKRYYSLLRNISLTAERDYPGWIVRIYHNIRDQGGPEREAHNQLCDIFCRFHNVDLCSVPLLVKNIGNDTMPIDPALLQGLNPKMFRYLVMFDPNVDVFISRDVDSIIWRREVDAVEEWLKSNYTFHVMRDHKFHGSIILAGKCPTYFYPFLLKFKLRIAGMWGAKLYQRRDLIQGLMRALVLAGQNQIGWQDQASLDTIVWPAAKYDVVRFKMSNAKQSNLDKIISKLYLSTRIYIIHGFSPELNRWPMTVTSARTSILRGRHR